MIERVKISLSIPGGDKPNKYFSLRPKQFLRNEPAEFKKPYKLLAVSDIEGEFNALYQILVRAKVINKRFEWIFGNGHLVIVGDCFDRGQNVMECLWLVYSLEERARREGGYVHFILGNHEIMNLNGDWRYVHPKYATTANHKLGHVALYGGNEELWRWLRTKNIIEKIGDILFVHGGIAIDMLNLQLSVDEINNKVRPFYTRSGEPFSDPLLNVVFNNNSPFWYRGYYQSSASQEQIDKTLMFYKVNTIVTGHTIVDKVSSFFDGKVINVNTDHSIGNSEALLMKRNQFYRVKNNGHKVWIK